MLSPWVPDDPVVSTVLGSTKTGDTYDVVDVMWSSLIMEYSSCVVHQLLSCVNTTCNWASLVDFLLNGLSSVKPSKFVYLVFWISVWDIAVFVWVTVSALHHGWASVSVIISSCRIDRASFVCDSVLVHPLVGHLWPSTVATHAERVTRYKNLGTDVNIWPGCVSRDFDSVWQSRSGSVCPAWTTVLWNVLVSNICQVVSPIDVVPSIVSRNIVHILFRWHVFEISSVCRCWFTTRVVWIIIPKWFWLWILEDVFSCDEPNKGQVCKVVHFIECKIWIIIL